MGCIISFKGILQPDKKVSSGKLTLKPPTQQCTGRIDAGRGSLRHSQGKSVCCLQKSNRRSTENSRKQIHDVLPDQKIEKKTKNKIPSLSCLPKTHLLACSNI